jgi:hypothetical protein
MTQTELEWSAFEYHYHPKTADWYWAVGIIVVSIVITSIIFNDLMFAIFSVVGAFALCVFASKKPPLLTCKITDRGVALNDVLYPYSTLESFWVEDHAHIAELHNPHHIPKMFLKSKRFFVPFITVPIDALDPEVIRESLRTYLPEEEHMEPLSQKIMEHLGF